MDLSKTETKSLMNTRIKQKPTIVKVLCLLPAVSVLSLLYGCASATSQESIPYNDMYEVRSYQIEVVTNEIVTTVFTLRLAETNVIKTVSKPSVPDFGGYDFDYIEPIEPVVKDNVTTSPELHCVDGSCALGTDIYVPTSFGDN